jgi:hypothetical protein
MTETKHIEFQFILTECNIAKTLHPHGLLMFQYFRFYCPISAQLMILLDTWRGCMKWQPETLDDPRQKQLEHRATLEVNSVQVLECGFSKLAEPWRGERAAMDSINSSAIQLLVSP